MLKPIKYKIETPAIGIAKMGILIQQKNPFKAINKKNITVESIVVKTIDINLSPMIIYIYYY